MSTADSVPTPQAILRDFVERFDAKTQSLFKSVRTAVRKRFPTANELFYDYGTFFVLAYSASDGPMDGVVTLSVRPEGVWLYLANGAKLVDPKRLLKGTAKGVRYIPLESAKQVADPDVEALIKQAVKSVKTPMPKSGKGELLIRTSGGKRQPKKKVAEKASKKSA